MNGVMEKTMGKKKAGRPTSGKPSNEGRLTRLDPAIVAMGKLVAASRGQHLSEYFASILRGPVQRDYASMVRELEKGVSE